MHSPPTLHALKLKIKLKRLLPLPLALWRAKKSKKPDERKKSKK
jgi:hypothetical protein